MKASDLSEFLRKTGLRPEDVATGTGLSTSTVYRFLRGETNNRVTVRVLSDFVASKGLVSPNAPLKATG